MDHTLKQFVEQKTKWNRFSGQLAVWVLSIFIPSWIIGYFLNVETCAYNNENLVEVVRAENSSYNEWITTYCITEFKQKLWAYVWVIIISALACVQAFKPRLTGYVPQTANAKTLKRRIAAQSIFIEFLPTIIGVAYILFFTPAASVYSTWAVYLITSLIQFIWLAPFWFHVKGKNIAETLTGITYTPTSKVFKKLESKFNNKSGYKGIEHVYYSLVLTICLIGSIQALRVPEQSSLYQNALYQNTNPIWEDNTYFAMHGLFAPEKVTDFYKYGLINTHKRHRAFEAMKKASGVREEYLFNSPDIDYGSTEINIKKEIQINDTQWKKLSCIFDLKEIKNDLCASLPDVPKYISENQIIWDRYSKAPDLGNIYKTPPQLLGTELKNHLKLAELKAAHIIFLAKNKQADVAIKEWLKYMALFRAMSEDRIMMDSKSVMVIKVKKFIKTLETLLYVSPELAKKYKNEIIRALKIEGSIFNEQHMMGTDWGQIEPTSLGTFGNYNALQNDLLICIEGFRELGLTHVKDFPYNSSHIQLCPMDTSDSSTYKYLIKAAITPGNFKVNMINVLLMPGILKGQELIKEMKILQIQFLQAQLAVELLSKQIAAYEIESYINSVGDKYLNPIEGKAFKWLAQEKAIAFHRPDGGRLSLFFLNIAQ